MAKDKYTAVWVSHSSISNFLDCPRAYYLKNIYKDPKTGHKISLITPPLSLGQAIHEVIESLSVLPIEKRFSESLIGKLDEAWEKISGKKGGFVDKKTEQQYKERGRAMLRKVMKTPGPLKNLAVKINMELPWFWLSEEDNIILCGKIDWLEYLPAPACAGRQAGFKDSNSVHIIDFKTGKNNEKTESLQLPIYHLLAYHCQDRPVIKASYWYLERDNKPIEKKLPDVNKAHDQVLKIAKQIKLARQLERFKCPSNGCRICRPLETVIEGRAELVGVGNYGSDIYIINQQSANQKNSVII